MQPQEKHAASELLTWSHLCSPWEGAGNGNKGLWDLCGPAWPYLPPAGLPRLVAATDVKSAAAQFMIKEWKK